MQFDNFMPFLTKPQQRDKKHCDTRSAAATEYDAFYEDSRTMWQGISVSDSGPPKRPESFLFISLNILKQFIEIRYVLLT